MGSTPDNISDYERAVKYEIYGDYSKAYELFQRCLLENTHDKAELLFHSGWCSELDVELDDGVALACYERAAELAVSPVLRVDSFFRAGWLLMQAKEYAKAGAFLKQALDVADLVGLKNETYRHAAYWYAVCLETQGFYIEAIKRYRLIQEIAPLLSPECRLREIVCLNHVGSYQEALSACLEYDSDPPEGFDVDRYRELSSKVERERDVLEKCLAHQLLPKREEENGDS
ncbi:MAG: tetratricopeptide repeat protein [Phycisphaerales bacterium]|nr:MAG: tetratricopeptide repeat protein [Phycisphaerales bacterium]